MVLDGKEVDLTNLTSVSTALVGVNSTLTSTDKLPLATSTTDKDKDKDKSTTSSSSLDKDKEKSTTSSTSRDKDSVTASSTSTTVAPDKDKDKTSIQTTNDKSTAIASSTSNFSTSATTTPDKDKTSLTAVMVELNKTISVVPVPFTVASVTTGLITPVATVQVNSTQTKDKDQTTIISSGTSINDKTSNVPDKDKTGLIPDKDKTAISFPASSASTNEKTSSLPDKGNSSQTGTGNPSTLTVNVTNVATSVQASGSVLFSVVGSSSSGGSNLVPTSSSITIARFTLTVPGTGGTGSPSTIVYLGSSPLAIPSKPESTGTTLIFTGGQSIGTISESPTGTKDQGDKSSTISFPRIKTSGTYTSSGNDKPSNRTTLVVPLWTPKMLGSAYGGGYITTPSIYITLSGTPGFTEGECD